MIDIISVISVVVAVISLLYSWYQHRRNTEIKEIISNYVWFNYVEINKICTISQELLPLVLSQKDPYIIRKVSSIEGKLESLFTQSMVVSILNMGLTENVLQSWRDNGKITDMQYKQFKKFLNNFN